MKEEESVATMAFCSESTPDSHMVAVSTTSTTRIHSESLPVPVVMMEGLHAQVALYECR